MAVASFEDLCVGLCDLVKVSPPALVADEHGLIAFHVVLRGATIVLAHRPSGDKDHFFVLFELGSLNDAETGESARLQELLDANFTLLQVNAPVYSRNPATGDAVLQCIYSLFEVTPTGLYAFIDKEVDSICRWREHSATAETGNGSWSEKKGQIPPPSNLLQIA